MSCSATKRLDVIQSIGMSSAADLDKLTKWIEESRLDPNDPSNADLMYLMRVSDAKVTPITSNKFGNLDTPNVTIPKQ